MAGAPIFWVQKLGICWNVSLMDSLSLPSFLSNTHSSHHAIGRSLALSPPPIFHQKGYP